jgi:hypothetical protein
MREDEDEHDDEGGTKQKKGRSPNFPQLTFTEALELARTIWNADKTHTVTVKIAAQHLGYKGVTGASLGVIAAMKRYGLLESIGDDVRVSDNAKMIFVHPEGDPDVDLVVRRLAMLPALFGKVLAEYKDLPSDATLRAKLETQWGFASEKAADTFIRALHEAIRIRDHGLAKSVGTGENAPKFIPERTMQGADSSQLVKQPPTPLPPHGYMSRQWEIGDGRVVSITLPADPTVNDVENLEEFLVILKQELALVWKKKGKVQANLDVLVAKDGES